MARCFSTFVTKTGQVVPCGKCFACVARRTSGWSFRVLKEQEVSDSCHWLTLTYDNENVPVSNNGFMTLEKTHVQLYIKQVRNWYRNEGIPLPKIKYYAVGEYGDKFKRPHYHVIVFNACEEALKFAWSRGNVWFGKLQAASANYTLKYMSKDPHKKKHLRDDRVAEFSLMSKGMGMSFVTQEMIDWYRADPLNRHFIAIEDGKRIPMPRYYRKHFFTPEDTEKFVEKMLADMDNSYITLQKERKFQIDRSLNGWKTKPEESQLKAVGTLPRGTTSPAVKKKKRLDLSFSPLKDGEEKASAGSARRSPQGGETAVSL